MQLTGATAISENYFSPISDNNQKEQKKIDNEKTPNSKQKRFIKLYHTKHDPQNKSDIKPENIIIADSHLEENGKEGEENKKLRVTRGFYKKQKKRKAEDHEIPNEENLPNPVEEKSKAIFAADDIKPWKKRARYQQPNSFDLNANKTFLVTFDRTNTEEVKESDYWIAPTPIEFKGQGWRFAHLIKIENEKNPTNAQNYLKRLDECLSSPLLRSVIRKGSVENNSKVAVYFAIYKELMEKYHNHFTSKDDYKKEYFSFSENHYSLEKVENECEKTGIRLYCKTDENGQQEYELMCKKIGSIASL